VHEALDAALVPGAGRCLVAAAALSPGTLVARLPFAACVYSPADPSDASDSWASTRELSAALLAFAADPTNAPVVAAWPGREACALGALAPESTLLELQCEPLAVEARKLSPLLRELAPSSDALWALSLAATRRCAVLCEQQPPGRRLPSTEVIAPIFDLANHGADPELAFEWRDGALEMRCRAAVSSGAQLRICYGPGEGRPHPSDHLFLTYGFVPAEEGLEAGEENVMLWRSEWHLAAWLLSLDGRSAALESDSRLTNGGAGWEGQRSWEQAPFDRREWLCVHARAGADGVELDVDPRLAAVAGEMGIDEERAAALLQTRATQLLAAFPTSLEEDEEAARRASDGLLLAAVRSRSAKKRLLATLVAAL